MQKTILLLGATGKLGNVLLKRFIEQDYIVTVLVRDSQKIHIQNKNLKVVVGNVTEKKDLTNALSGNTIVVSALGHGFRTSFPIQEKTLSILLPLMEEKKIKRFITVTGSGLLVKGDPRSVVASFLELAFSFVDPYRLADARSQQNLLEKSTTDWTVVRTPIHANKQGRVTHIGFTQPPLWQTVSRDAVADFFIDCIEKNLWIQKSPIIY